MQRLGVILGKEFYRKDINELLSELSDHYEVIPIVRNPEGFQKMYWADKLTGMRAIQTADSTKRRLLKWLFRYFGHLPSSITNYKVVTYFGLANIRNRLRRKLAEKVLLPLTVALPKFITFDQYLSYLPDYDHTDIEDIDHFLFFSQITEEELLARLLHLRKKVIVYLYSWDHAAKLKNLPRQNVKYLVWCDEVKKDLSELNSIPEEAIEIVGASQFTEIFKYQQQQIPRPKKIPAYVYFGFSTMYAPLVRQEMDFVKKLSDLVEELKLPLTIRVRTYPILENQSIYAPLADFPHVEVEETNRLKSLTTASLLYEKYDAIAEAAAFFHFGTTMGVECCFFDTPSFIVDYTPSSPASTPKGWSLINFVHQYQNEKYLLSPPYPNVVKSDEALKQVLTQIAAGHSAQYMPYNKYVASLFPLVSISDIASNIKEVVTNARQTLPT